MFLFVAVLWDQFVLLCCLWAVELFVGPGCTGSQCYDDPEVAPYSILPPWVYASKLWAVWMPAHTSSLMDFPDNVPGTGNPWSMWHSWNRP